ncbi:hypothetical protein CRG98_042760 [Punica granatum]|uniref:Uncharacterized protein n=1 Tax=Punica granatum TaxID=22663 RepID=A0A2I0HYP5_PUNGR|nr:hypothetical protein CRG98_042760 [Punica granatum]
MSAKCRPLPPFLSQESITLSLRLEMRNRSGGGGSPPTTTDLSKVSGILQRHLRGVVAVGIESTCNVSLGRGTPLLAADCCGAAPSMCSAAHFAHLPLSLSLLPPSVAFIRPGSPPEDLRPSPSTRNPSSRYNPRRGSPLAHEVHGVVGSSSVLVLRCPCLQWLCRVPTTSRKPLQLQGLPRGTDPRSASSWLEIHWVEVALSS